MCLKLEDVEIGQQIVSNNWKLILKCYREVTAVAQLKYYLFLEGTRGAPTSLPTRVLACMHGPTRRPTLYGEVREVPR